MGLVRRLRESGLLATKRTHRRTDFAKVSSDAGSGAHFSSQPLEAGAGISLCIPSQLGLQNGFEANQSYTIRPCLDKEGREELLPVLLATLQNLMAGHFLLQIPSAYVRGHGAMKLVLT